MARITGLGGIFYKVEDPERTRAWYREILGIGGEWGAHFRWADEPQDDPYSLASPFKASRKSLARASTAAAWWG